LTVPEGAAAEQRLKRCGGILDAYAEAVDRAVHAPFGTESTDA
jgi:hypothetical protein